MHGYSSSSESDDDYNYRKNRTTVPAATNSNDKTKQKKKRKLPPQQSINRIWKRFSNKRFNKAVSVLPFDPVLPPTISERSNELLSAGYERAATECRRKVQKIIQECRRVNMRYRDPGWDLDWDLKMEKGHCLNSLGRTKYDLSMSTMLNPSAVVPKAVKRVHEIFEKPTFMANVSGNDVKQGSLGDCWLMASFSGLANVEDGIKRICVEYDTRIGIYGFVFYRDGEWIYSIIDDKLFLRSPCWDSPSMQRDLLQQIDREDVERVYRQTYQTGSKALFFAQCKDQNETWVPLIEKAYAKAHGDYASLSGGWIGEGLEDLSGGVTTELLASDILDLDGFWENELSRVNDEFLFGCSTGLLDGGYGDRDGISEGHAYVVMEARTLKNGTRLLKLRNPWGKTKKGIWEGAWSDGSKEWTTEVQEELGHQFGSDSVFWISYEDLLRKYQHFDRTRLFREKDWRCCQRWIGVEVPWKPQYNEKFHIKLTKESPLVVVLSQLDNRYFKGLTGQYSFRLQFRLHEEGRPDPEDYIVRSHGNYLMDRSVSIELPCMLPGSYSVFISVIGERDTDVPSIEDVVKRECKKRVENEKLAQVGYAYDLAHSKAAAHLEAVKKLRKKADQKKASDARVHERRKLWEKRHLNREITKKQGRKNNAKLEAKQAAREAKKRKEEELKPKDAGVQTEATEEKKETEAKVEDTNVDDKNTTDTKTEDTKTDDKAKEDKVAEDKPTDEKKFDDKTDETTESKDDKPSEAQPDTKAEGKTDDKAEGEPEVTDSAAKEEITVDISNDANDSDDDDEDTPLATPSETPTIEKTEDEATEGQDETPTVEKTEDQAIQGQTEPEEKPEEKPENKSEKPAEDKTETKGDDKATEPAPKPEDKTPASAASSDSSDSPQLTPKTEASTPATTSATPLAAASGAPPPPPAQQQQQPHKSSRPPPPPKKAPNMYVTSDGESSASPVEEWEELYSSDDMTRKPRMAAPPPPGQATVSKYRDDTEDENDPDPWNAICVVGLRVYSKDEDLELRIVMEGGELEEGGMGEKGGVDLDNAQANAGGARSKVVKEDTTEEVAYEGDSEVDKSKKSKGRQKSVVKIVSDDEKDGKKKGKKDKSGDETVDEDEGKAPYPVIVQKGKGDEEYETAVESQLEN
ncbi:putative calpain [Podospora australis]|uniref:Calpain n=1 Tax=Podospora australis TaxID=1536484 RepID=A0AAN6WUY7_9PEZI|nr:putative calpain [Podospora australis]